MKELNAYYDSRKSFYGKARIEESDREIKLISYNTHVATIYKNDDYSVRNAEINGIYSPTTLRHIKEFLRQYGFTAETKKQIENDYLMEG